MRHQVRKYAPSESYLALVREFALKPIHDERAYKAAVGVMKRLAVRGEFSLDKGERDYLDALDAFISAYDERGRTVSHSEAVSTRLRLLMQDSETSSADLQKILGCGHSLISLMLNGKRELSKNNIRVLASHFKLSAEYFL